MKNKLIFISVAIFCMLLPSCGKKDKKIPVYEGMSISKEVMAPLQAPKYKEGDNGNHYGHYGKDDEDSEVENPIENIVDIDVVSNPQTEYYVQPNEEFIVEVHISNPKNYEIQSFTLNGQKYANYMFENGSTMELLLLKTTAPSTSGYHEYTIDAIKYIEGTQIKDVDMSKADKKVKVGVAYDNLPKANLTGSTIGTTSATLQVYIHDPHSLIQSNELSIHLSDGENIVESKNLNVGTNTIVFNGLEMSRQYQFGIVTLFDGADGRNTHQEWLLIDEFLTKPAFEITNVQQEKTSISFELNQIDQIANVTSVKLYDKNTEALVKQGDGTTRSFEGLLSNHEYVLYVDYSYSLNGSTKTDFVYYENIKTSNKVEPTISFGEVSSDSGSINYEILVDDVDQIATIDNVQLLLNGEVIKENNGDLNGSFSELLSNKSYVVKVNYKYDLNEGEEDISKSIEQEIKTAEVAAPAVTIDTIESTKTAITFAYSVDDPINLLTIENVELYHDDVVVDTIEDLTVNSFANLLSNNTYKVRINYHFDLNDGKGEQRWYVEREIKTLPKISPAFSFNGLTATQNSVSYKYTKMDPDQTLVVDGVELYLDDTLIETITDGKVSGTFSNLSPDTLYKVRFNYHIDLNDGAAINYLHDEHTIRTQA